MLDNLRTRKYQALILDSPVVQYFAAIAEQCDLYPVGDPWETFNLAIAFPPDTPDQLPANISASIVRLQVGSRPSLAVVAMQVLIDSLWLQHCQGAQNSLPTQCGHAQGRASIEPLIC